MTTFNSCGNQLTDGTHNITLAGNLTTSGSNPITFTTTGTTNVTLPTSGTLSTGNFPTTVVSSTSATMAGNNAYIPNNVSLVTLTLPTTAAVGDMFIVNGLGAGGWRIGQASGQSIQFTAGGSVTATTTGTGGHIDSSVASDCVGLRCITANTLFEVYEAMGNISYT